MPATIKKKCGFLYEKVNFYGLRYPFEYDYREQVKVLLGEAANYWKI